MRTINQYIIENKWKVKLNIRTVNVGARPIRSIWTPEMVQDISAFHNIDVETELTRILNEELSRNIDTGLVFAPYIPVQLDPVMLDNRIVGVSSRYVSVQVNPNNYGVINMPNVNGGIFV